MKEIIKKIIGVIKKILKYIFSKIKNNKKKTIFFLVVFLCIRSCNNYFEEVQNCDDWVIKKDTFGLYQKRNENLMSDLVRFRNITGKYPEDRKDFAKIYKNHEMLQGKYSSYWERYVRAGSNVYIYVYNYTGGHCTLGASKSVVVHIYNPSKGWFHKVSGQAGGKYSVKNGGYLTITIKGKTAADNKRVEISKYIRDYVDKGIDPFKKE